MYYQDTLLTKKDEIIQRKDSIISMQKTLIDSCEYVSHNAYNNAKKLLYNYKKERNKVFVWQGISVFVIVLTLIF
jgi:hypothetical protein